MASVVSDIDLPEHVPESDITAANASLETLFSLKGRTIVITGAGRGLGITLATAVLEAGADAICLDVLDEPSSVEWAVIKTVEHQSRVEASYYKCDVTNEDEVKQVLNKAVDSAKARGKPIRGMINSAGIQLMKDAIDYPIDGFRRVMDVSISGTTSLEHYQLILA
jgi:NAD(P)-dependent dehydrogenase (short-subunit alcohol dehydrogenase family)